MLSTKRNSKDIKTRYLKLKQLPIIVLSQSHLRDTSQVQTNEIMSFSVCCLWKWGFFYNTSPHNRIDDSRPLFTHQKMSLKWFFHFALRCAPALMIIIDFSLSTKEIYLSHVVISFVWLSFYYFSLFSSLFLRFCSMVKWKLKESKSAIEMRRFFYVINHVRKNEWKTCGQMKERAFKRQKIIERCR